MFRAINIITLFLLITLFVEAAEKYHWKKLPINNEKLNNHSLKNPVKSITKFRKRQIESLCSRFHNNTAYLGIKPIFSATIDTVRQCRDACLDLYPYCVAVIFYKMATLNISLCYLFNKNSIHKDVILYPERPLAEHDIINVIEIVADCHEFDAIPPLPDTFITSSDKVSRARRANNIGNSIKRNGLWTRWTNCNNDTKYQIRSQSCEYGRMIQKRQCFNKSSEIPPFLHPSPFHPYPPEPYKHPDDKSNEYQHRLAGHMKQLQRSRINCCKRQEWYREHVNKNYIEICRHPCPPFDLLNTDEDLEQLPCNQQLQYISSEEPTSRIQEYNKVQTEEIIMLPEPVTSMAMYENIERKNEQEQSIIKTQLSSLNGADLPQETQETTEEYQKDKTINHMAIDERIRTHEGEYFHQLQSRQDNESIKLSLINDKENHLHQPITSQNYRYEEHDDYYQQHQKPIKDYSQQGEFVNEHDSTFEDHFHEHNRNQQQVPSENDEAGESELDGTDYGYDYDSHDETPVTDNQKQIAAQETNNQFSHQTYPYDTHETFSSTLMPYLNSNQELHRSEHMQNHHAISPVEGYYSQQQEAPYDDHYRQEQKQMELSKSLPDNYHGEQQVQLQPSESASDDYYFQQQEQQDLSTASSQNYHQEQEAQLQSSGFELDEYYHRHQQQEFPTEDHHPTEDYQQETQSQLSGKEFENHYLQQQTEQIQPQLSESKLDEHNRRQQQEFSTISPEDYRREQEAQLQTSGFEYDEYDRGQQAQQIQPSESELDEYNRQHQQQEFSTEDYRREQEAQPQTSGFEHDEYYRGQQVQQIQLQPPESKLDEYNRQHQQQEFSTEDYSREQKTQPQSFESELDEYYRRQQAQQVQPQPSESELDEYYRRQQAQQVQPQPSESELDEYYRRQQAQQVQPQPSESEPDDYYRQQQAQQVQPQPSESELDEYYSRQQAQQVQPEPSESELDDYYSRQQAQQVQPQPSESEPDDYYRQQQAQQVQPQPSEFELYEYYRRQQAQKVQPQPSESELDDYYNRQQAQQVQLQPSESELDEYYRRQQTQQVQPQPSESELDEYYRRQQAQQVQPQPSESELDEYYRRQQQQREDYRREQETQQQFSIPLPDDHYLQQQQQQQQKYVIETDQDDKTAPYYPYISRQEWNSWTTWSICPITCGDGFQTRQRACPAGIYCHGEAIQQRPCHFRPCGMRSEWSDWCECE